MSISRYILLGFIWFLTVPNSNAQQLEEVLRPFLNFKTLSYTGNLVEKGVLDDKLYRNTIKASFDYSGKDSVQKVHEKAYAAWRDANKLITLDYLDSTYKVKERNEYTGPIDDSFLERIKQTANKYPTFLKEIPKRDSVLDGKTYYLYEFTPYDSVSNNKRFYETTKLLVDKKTFVPALYRFEFATTLMDNVTYVTYFVDQYLHNIRINDPNFKDISDMTLPANFKSYVPKKRLPMLVEGTDVPSLSFLDQEQQPLDLTNFKGKVILLNISLVACPHSVNSVKMLNDFHHTYGDQNLVIISVYPVDAAEDVQNMVAKFNIEYPYYQNTKNTQVQLKEFQTSGYPAFYVIDKNAKIKAGFAGFSDEIAKKIKAKIEQSIL